MATKKTAASGSPKNPKQTGPKAASDAGKVLRDPKSSRAAKTAAASDLAQAPAKPKKPKGK